MSTRKNRVEAERVSPTAVEVVKAISTITDHLVEHGFIFYDRAYWKLDVSILSDGFLNSYGKKICKELGRPWVRASGGYYEQYQWSQHPDGKYKRVAVGKQFGGHLTVPKRNYLAPIVAPLLIVAGDRGSSPVTNSSTASNWEFSFMSENPLAAEIWENHIQFMRTDEAARKALKVLPK
jgi:hypothetical protein